MALLVYFLCSKGNTGVMTGMNTSKIKEICQEANIE